METQLKMNLLYVHVIRAIARVGPKKVKLVFGLFSLDFSKKVKLEISKKVK